MDLSKLQSRVSSSYIPPHRTQLHPRTILYPNPRASSSSSNRDKCLILFASLFVFPFLFYLFYTALGVHQSSKFGESKTNLFGIIINASPTHSRIHVFEFLNPGSTSLEVKPGLSWFAGDPEGAGRSVVELIEFAKKRVPKSEWRNTKVQLMGSSDLERVELVAREAIFESCRRVLRSSGFLFKNEWVAIMEGREEALYAWVAANYALGSLGGEPQDTTGIVELGGASLQVAFSPRDPQPMQLSQIIKLVGVTYNLYTKSIPYFGQDA
ncbi:probable apyrase 6, partial [Camellia sinensis]|uniref:probable apyrase 6 n=1 Tax=Camellia sinensis TaxID=4442 RepID=UPI0010360E2E